MFIINVALHFDKYIPVLIDNYGPSIYLILFLIIFCETGFVITPFLPGDSIIFACGALGASSGMNILSLSLLLTMAAILGDGINYIVGKSIGRKIIKFNTPIIKAKYIREAQKFYDKYGSKAIFLSRFVPIVRTFAPFVAGVGKMEYRKFGIYNVLGGIVWVNLFLIGGFIFGNFQIVKDNFSIVLMVIIIISVVPIFYEIIKHKMESNIKLKDKKVNY
ncbi:VTT domain-containing protein [Clostridium cylindrosporum]|uniref:Protein DedA n=1 Tax=Clostridium cylindrosporum DSM 605 TaxID=1121307 RepID=A0A0J8DBE0_CLOCY|nr:VTT domain-containing protein [Clostridium cylindrosporum]KMT23385.1 protein DedA [Clostridium cylindrosporum DSM 605]